MESESKIWLCCSCSLEFDLNDTNPEFMIIRGPRFGKCVIELDGRAHSLRNQSWRVAKKVRDLEDHSRSTNPSNLYEEKGDVEKGTDAGEIRQGEEPSADGGNGTVEDLQQ
jgi:hypothetical protein